MGNFGRRRPEDAPIDRAEQRIRAEAAPVDRPMLAERSRTRERIGQSLRRSIAACSRSIASSVDRSPIAADRSQEHEEKSLSFYFTRFLLLFLVFFELFWDISEFLIYLVGKLGL